ncbi:MAG: epoxyqueuosine reductase QueH [Clostridiales bacterium]|nr:epoxyqueuosine reductase QueH [Clostridiales bacterium]
MNIKENYHKIMLDKLSDIKGQEKIPSLLLHSCCAPCSSYVLEVLSNYFRITISYYNPNIYPKQEFSRRFNELKKFVKSFPLKNEVEVLELSYIPDEFYSAVRGMENEREGGERCFKCYELRLEKAAIIAKQMSFDWFTTALSISPHKNAQKINEIGYKLEKKYNVKYLPADFKKNNGFKRSIEISREYDLYRQDYCGCVFSKNN